MTDRSKIFVTKASNESAEFSENKLRNSMKRAGASDEEVDKIVQQVYDKLYQGISTKKIYKIAFGLLRNSSKHVAARYHLKGAIMELGPSGYPFEKFVGAILSHQGYDIKIGQVVKGQCVQHEIDVIAERKGERIMIECKYHNRPGIVCDVKIPLYIQARFKDVEAEWLKMPEHSSKIYRGWVVTNTKFTSDAIQYGTCAGLKLVGWSYPDGNSLRSQIDTLKLYPITCLTSLTKFEKQKLLENKIVLCQELSDDRNLLVKIGIKDTKIDAVMREANLLCSR
jgi:hypothetical protein